MNQMKMLALAAAITIAYVPTAFAQATGFPFQIVEIRHSDRAFCEVVVQTVEKDSSVEGYALVVGINAKQSIKMMREGVVKNATVKGAELCKVISGKLNQELSGAKSVWEMIGLQDKPEGACVVELPKDVTFQGPVRVKAQLLALSNGKWIEKSKLLEKTLKP